MAQKSLQLILPPVTSPNKSWPIYFFSFTSNQVVTFCIKTSLKNQPLNVSLVYFVKICSNFLTSLGRGQGWAIGHCQSLVHVPGTHFRLTFAVHLVWTLLRSISKYICFLPTTTYNNCFTQFYSLFYTPATFILVCSADHGLV